MKTKILLIIALLFGNYLNAQTVTATATVGQAVTMTVNVGSGTPPFVFTWTKNDKPWTPPAPPVNTSNSSVVTIASAQLTDAGNYLVSVWNPAGNTNTPLANLLVVPSTTTTLPAITAQPNAKTVTIGSSVVFSVTATGTPSPSYQWQRNGVKIAGATSASFAIPNAQLTDAGNYSVIVSNSAGAVTSSVALLTVNQKLILPGNVSISIEAK